MSTQVLLIGSGLFQDGLDRVLKNHAPDIEIIGIAKSWDEAKILLASVTPDALIADYQYADTIVADMESLTSDNEKPLKVLFVIPDENRMIVYQRQQMTDLTIDRFIEAL